MFFLFLYNFFQSISDFSAVCLQGCSGWMKTQRSKARKHFTRCINMCKELQINCSPNSVHTEGFLVGVKGGFFHCGMLCGPRLFHCKFLRKIYLVRCPCVQARTKRLSRFASRSFFVAGAVLYRLREKSV